MQDISLGIKYHQAGRLADAELIYRQVLASNPDHSDALHWLGVVGHQMGKNEAARELIEKAISFNDSVPAYYSHLGMVYRGLKRFGEAISCFQKAIAMQPDNAEAYNNIGNLFAGQLKIDDAISSYQKALAINPALVEAYKNIGDIFKMEGQTDEALIYYKKARLMAPNSFSAQDAALSTSILHYLGNDLKGARKQLAFAKAMFGGISRSSVASQTYCNYLEFLLTWWGAKLPTKHTTKLETLYVIGESHSLSLHNIIVPIEGRHHLCQAKWIEGCKQWHLAGNESNIYKYQVTKIFQHLPENSIVLLAIGEIDCRHNEGIFPLWKKSNGNLREVISVTVNGYLDYIRSLTIPKNIRLIVNGIPASNANLKELTKEDKEKFGFLLSYFNVCLKKAASEKGMDFLDVFALTDVGHGFADGTWHLDSHHLRPDAMKTAFVQQLKFN